MRNFKKCTDRSEKVSKRHFRCEEYNNLNLKLNE